MLHAYRYIGPADLLDLVSHAPDIHVRRIGCAADVAAWAQQTRQTLGPEGEVTATYIIDRERVLWIGERRMEHVVVARGEPVLMAGELTFELTVKPCVIGASNQSTGFCPEPSGWEHLRHALNVAGIAHPGALTRAFEFRRCEKCGMLQLVKDNDFYCAACDVRLPDQWNVDNV
jgi:hypothetical protein